MTRPIPALALALLAISATLAGCIGAEDPETASTSQPTTDESMEEAPPSTGGDDGEAAAPAANATAATNTTRSPALELAGCTEHLGLFPLPAGGPWAQVPEGFEPEPFMGQAGTIGFFVAAIACDTGSHANASLAEPTLMAGGITVVPPAEFEDGATIHGILVGGFSDTPQFVDVLSRWGMPIEEAPFLQNTMGLPGIGQSGQAVAGPTGFQVALATEVTAQLADEAGYTARFYHPEEGRVTSYVDVVAQGAEIAWDGSATFHFPEPPPVLQGVGVHRAGDGYGYTMTYTGLPP